MKKTYFSIIISTIMLMVVLTSCSKEDLATVESKDLSVSEQSYKQKLQAFTVNNSQAAKQLGINILKAEKTERIKFKSYQEAYEFFARLKKGITSSQKDTCNAVRSKKSGMSTMSWGVDEYFYNHNISTSTTINDTMGTHNLLATWGIDGTLGYSYIQSSPTAPKNYNSVMPYGTSLSDPFLAYSGIGSVTASQGAWNGSASSFTMVKQTQIEYTISGLGFQYNGSIAVETQFTTGIGWSVPPGQVYISYSMTATAY